MDKIKKNFGFGCMRLPMIGDKVDIEQTKQMVDMFLERGFNYFDTAHGYIGGQSETAIRECLTSRYPREAYILTDKLSQNFFNREEDIRPLFKQQLEACGVDYFDFFLMHSQNASNYPKYKACRAYETAFDLKKEGLVRHVGISFHDSPELLEQILTDYPEVEVVQIQLNYLDYDNLAIQSRRCLEVIRKHNKPAIIMEPVKGGTLVNLPEEATKVLTDLNNGSVASYAVRFAAGCEGVMMVLSGMSSLEQMDDNSSYMQNFVPLNEEEQAAIAKVVDIFNSKKLIPCTGCSYCTEGCPMQINIPQLFTCYNNKELSQAWNAASYYRVATTDRAKASECIKCGQCESICPQHLPIRDLLETVAETFEK